MDKTLARKELKEWAAGLPGREYQQSVITKIGYEYIHFVNLHDSKLYKISIHDFLWSRDLYFTGNHHDYIGFYG